MKSKVIRRLKNMESKVYNTPVGEIKIIKIEKRNITILRNGMVSHMSESYLRYLLGYDE